MSRTAKILAGLPQSLCAVAAPAFVALVVVGGAAAQTPAAAGPSASPAPPAPHATAAAVAPVGLPTPKPVHHHYRRASAMPGYAAVSAANAGARAYATPDAYINAVLYYDYEAGRIYTLQTSPRFLTTVLLRPGEKLIAKAAGDTVRWVAMADGLSVAAYHPMKRCSRRIPLGAVPWNSGPLARGQSFCLTLAMEGVYDYFCPIAERDGMVGRIVVGRGGAVPIFDRSIPSAARAAFPSVEEILRRGAA